MQSKLANQFLQFGPHQIPYAQLFILRRNVFATVNLKPILPGHVLVCSRRQVRRLSDLTEIESVEFWITVQEVAKKMQELYKMQCDITIQDGREAGQTIEHVHCHIIPQANKQKLAVDAESNIIILYESLLEVQKTCNKRPLSYEFTLNRVYYDYLMFFIFLITSTASQLVFLTIDGTTSQVWNGDGGYDPQFHQKDSTCCTPPYLYLTYSMTSVVTLQYGTLVNDSISVGVSGKQISGYATVVSDTTFQVNLQCESNSIAYSGMTQISFSTLSDDSIQSKIRINYWIICNTTGTNVAITFDWSNIILLVIAVLLVFIISSHARIISLRLQVPSNVRWLAGANFGEIEDSARIYFQGLRVNLWYMLIYIVGVCAYYIIMLMVPEEYTYVFEEVCVLMVGFIAGFFCLNELFCFMSANLRLRTVVFYQIRVCDLLSLGFIILIITEYAIGQSWYMNNIIAILIIGGTIKIFRVTSLKTGAAFLCACTLFDVLFYVAINLSTSVTYQSLVLKVANLPFIVQLPLFNDSYLYICCWLSATDILLPGLIISYLNRFDRNRNSLIYTSISSIGLFFGILIWLLVQIAISKSGSSMQIPQSIFVFTIMIGSTSIWAYKQAEFDILWQGYFFDKYIDDPLFNDGRLELTPASLDQDLFKGLNPN